MEDPPTCITRNTPKKIFQRKFRQGLDLKLNTKIGLVAENESEDDWEDNDEKTNY